jgi:hypothetical protein
MIFNQMHSKGNFGDFFMELGGDCKAHDLTKKPKLLGATL